MSVRSLGQQEHLDGDVVLQVGLAGERAHLAPGGLLDQGLELVGHDRLEVAADLLDVLGLAVADERPLRGSEGLLQHHDDQVTVGVDLRLGGATAVVLAVQADEA